MRTPCLISCFTWSGSPSTPRTTCFTASRRKSTLSEDRIFFLAGTNTFYILSLVFLNDNAALNLSAAWLPQNKSTEYRNAFLQLFLLPLFFSSLYLSLYISIYLSLSRKASLDLDTANFLD